MTRQRRQKERDEAHSGAERQTAQPALFDMRPFVKDCPTCRASVAIAGDYGFYCPTCGAYHPDQRTAEMGKFIHFDDDIRRAYFARADVTQSAVLAYLKSLQNDAKTATTTPQRAL